MDGQEASGDKGGHEFGVLGLENRVSRGGESERGASEQEETSSQERYLQRLGLRGGLGGFKGAWLMIMSFP